MKYDDIRLRYAMGYITEAQLAEYVELNVISPSQADAIKLSATDPLIVEMKIQIEEQSQRLQAAEEAVSGLMDIIAMS